MVAELQIAIPDAYVGEDGTLFIVFSIEAGQFENGFLANQLALNDMFVQTASLQALRQRGAERNLNLKDGTRSTGSVLLEGSAATYIPLGSEVAYDPGGGLEILYFSTTVDGSIPNPGIPTAPTAAVNVAAGNLNGLYEYVVTYVTAGGETLPSALSAAVNPATQQVNLTNIPVGGPGTTARRVYRDKGGTGIYRRVVEIADNTTIIYTDNITDAVVAGNAQAPTVDTSHRITLAAEAIDTGVEGNVGAGTITDISRAPASLTSVTNQAAFTGGSDREDTETFRQRLLEFMSNPQTGSPADLKAWAENVAGVETATVFTNDNLGVATPGHATVRISGPGGAVPGAPVIAAVLAALIDQGLANITYHVATFVADVTAVTADVTTSGTYVLADVTAQVTAAITDYINNLGVGETLYISGLIAAIKPLTGIADVVITAPAANQVTAATHKRTPGVISVV